ncbi:hypothetical protein MTP99_016549 [Tenebrio molitor]|jgi:hypothetical protein|uniref:Uncharacterized protein n=1 Tax=Tenebrio molitor TaxID=7067 RepID=A0A8J6LIZ3_TENMO|nr:hypothetical protein GEV33_002284 [Tenebrio molitor]KAJ3626022.1 hypothetical protein MTP99_016549 [Tenebrio molitor]
MDDIARPNLAITVTQSNRIRGMINDNYMHGTAAEFVKRNGTPPHFCKSKLPAIPHVPYANFVRIPREKTISEEGAFGHGLDEIRARCAYNRAKPHTVSGLKTTLNHPASAENPNFLQR